MFTSQKVLWGTLSFWISGQPACSEVPLRYLWFFPISVHKNVMGSCCSSDGSFVPSMKALKGECCQMPLCPIEVLQFWETAPESINMRVGCLYHKWFRRSGTSLFPHQVLQATIRRDDYSIVLQYVWMLLKCCVSFSTWANISNTSEVIGGRATAGIMSSSTFVAVTLRLLLYLLPLEPKQTF